MDRPLKLLPPCRDQLLWRRGLSTDRDGPRRGVLKAAHRRHELTLAVGKPRAGLQDLRPRRLGHVKVPLADRLAHLKRQLAVVADVKVARYLKRNGGELGLQDALKAIRAHAVQHHRPVPLHLRANHVEPLAERECAVRGNHTGADLPLCILILHLKRLAGGHARAQDPLLARVLVAACKAGGLGVKVVVDFFERKVQVGGEWEALGAKERLAGQGKRKGVGRRERGGVRVGSLLVNLPERARVTRAALLQHQAADGKVGAVARERLVEAFDAQRRIKPRMDCLGADGTSRLHEVRSQRGYALDLLVVLGHLFAAHLTSRDKALLATHRHWRPVSASFQRMCTISRILS